MKLEQKKLKEKFLRISRLALVFAFTSFCGLTSDKDFEQTGNKNIYHLVCTPGAKDTDINEFMANHTVTSLDLTKASNLENPLSIFQNPLPELRHLKMEFGVEKVLKILPDQTQNLEILNITDANIFETTLLTCLNRIPSLKVLDISGIYSNKKIPEILESLLSENKTLVIHINSLRKMSPHQKKIDLSVYKDNCRVILEPYRLSIEEITASTGFANKYVIY